MKRFFRILTLIATISFIIASFSITRAASTIVDVSFIDVGQGDSALIHDDNNFDVLIDGGIRSAGPTVVAYLRDQSIDDIEVLVASHADADHIGGLIDVLQAADIPVESVLYNGYPGTTLTWTDFVNEVTNQGLTMEIAQFPQEYTWGSMTAYVLNPISGLTSPDQNEASIVLLVKHGDIDFLFTGDIGTSTEGEILARGTPVASEVLKVAHHGSAYSSSATFLSAVSPEYAVISVGSNPYGHPAQDTLDRLAAASANILRTDQEGTIVFSSDGITYGLLTSTPEYTLYLPIILKNYSPPTPSPTPTPDDINPPEVTIIDWNKTPDSCEVTVNYRVYDPVWSWGIQSTEGCWRADAPPGVSPPVMQGCPGPATQTSGGWDQDDNWDAEYTHTFELGMHPSVSFPIGWEFDLRVYAQDKAGAEHWVDVATIISDTVCGQGPTPTPTDTPEPDVNITYIFYDGVVPFTEDDEYAEITNQGSTDVNLSGWRLNAGDPGQDFYFPSYTLVIGESCRVYTNEFHPEYCGFNFERGSAIWSNSGDCGYLYNDLGSLASTYCY